MSPTPTARPSIHVTIAAAIVVALAGLLIARLTTSTGTAIAAEPPTPPTAHVPVPTLLGASAPEIPCWTCPESKEWAIRFRTDLDLLAPLGNGTANAGVFFKDFEKRRGPRAAEVVAARKLIDEHPKAGKAFPYDHPLVREAEPWCDQATMRYYPDIFPLDGYATRITDLLFQLTLARTWVARGYDSGNPDAAMADFRRAIRLGRLLRQEDIVIINDLVGLACIRIGAQAVYDLAIKRGDLELALVASAVLGEAAPQKLLTSARVTETDIGGGFVREDDGRVTLNVRDHKLDAIIARARSAPDRRFRAEAMISLNLVRFLAASTQRQRALEVLDELSHNPDPVVAYSARWSRDTRPDDAQVAEFMKESAF